MINIINDKTIDMEYHIPINISSFSQEETIKRIVWSKLKESCHVFSFSSHDNESILNLKYKYIFANAYLMIKGGNLGYLDLLGSNIHNKNITTNSDSDDISETLCYTSNIGVNFYYTIKFVDKFFFSYKIDIPNDIEVINYITNDSSDKIKIAFRESKFKQIFGE